MATWPRIAAIALLGATAARTSDVDPNELYSRIRAKVVDNARRLAKYACVETIERTQYLPPGERDSCNPNYSGRGPISVRDRLRLDVTVMNDNEIFSWAGARRFETAQIDKIVETGAIGSGEFGGSFSAFSGTRPTEHASLAFATDSPGSITTFRWQRAAINSIRPAL